jgi:hypothetical protein
VAVDVSLEIEDIKMNGGEHSKLIQDIVGDRDTSQDTAVICADRGLAFSYAEISRMAGASLPGSWVGGS